MVCLMANRFTKITATTIAVIILILVVASAIKFPESKEILKKELKNNCFVTEGKKEATITNYNAECGKEVEIPDKINDKKVIGIEQYAFRKKGITKVKMPNTITSIGDFAFLENELTEVKLPSDLKTIGYGAFETNKLKNVIIPDKVEKIGHYAFYENDLESFTVGKSVKEINLFALSKNPNLKEVIIKQGKGKLDTGAMGTKAQITYTN